MPEIATNVMNSRAEIQQAFEDYQLGKMGEIDA